MIVAVTVANHTEYTERCPFNIHGRSGMICSHPAIELGRTELFCNYRNVADGKRIDASARCPLLRESVGGITVEAVLK